METLGQRIRRERQGLGFTVREFARRVGVTAPHVTDIEADRRRPSPEVLGRIAANLEVPLADLEALDTRLRPEVKEWIEKERPEVGQLLRRLRSHPEQEEVLKKLAELLDDDTKEKKK